MIALSMFLQAVRIAVPYLFAAAGGVLSERAGVICLALEGYMLTGAFCAALGTHATGNPYLGVACGMAGGVLCAGLLAVATLRYRADQVVVGIAVNLLVVGATRFFLQLVFDSSSNSPRIEGFGQFNPLLLAGLLAIPAVAFVVDRSVFGLRLRAVGEHPVAAETLGVSVGKVRVVAVLASGALAALGGAWLALDQHQFTDQMTAGRGFIALAAIIFGRWEPRRVGAACALFAVAETAQIHLQGTEWLPSQAVAAIPYVLTIVALAGLVGRSQPPAALGRA